MKKKNQQLYSTEREYSSPFRREQMSLGSSSGVHRKSPLSALALASALSFVTILLSLFTLNYSSIFNLATLTAHAADVSTTDLSFDVPTTIALSVVKSNPQCTGDELETSDTAAPATAQLCLNWTNDKTATGTQTVSVRTNSPYGYNLHVDTGASRLFNAQNEYLNFTCSLSGSKDCVYSREDFSDQDNTHDFTYTITSSKPKQQLTAGDYTTSITYTATAYFAWGDGKESINADSQIAYDFDYTGAYQKFTAPKAGKYKIELWGASGSASAGGGSVVGDPGYGGYAVGETGLDEGESLYLAVGGTGTSQSESKKPDARGGWNGGMPGSFTFTHDGVTAGGATSVQTSLIGDGQLKNYEAVKDTAVLMVAGGGGSGEFNSNGGSGGGYIGGSGTSVNYAIGDGGTQNSGGAGRPYVVYTAFGDINGSFGLGGNGDADDGGPHGGGGWYGGGAVTYAGGSGGGSGYIGSSLLTNKHMYGYNVPTSDEASTKTIAGTCYNATATADCAKKGNGYARITYLGELTLRFT